MSHLETGLHKVLIEIFFIQIVWYTGFIHINTVSHRIESRRVLLVFTQIFHPFADTWRTERPIGIWISTIQISLQIVHQRSLFRQIDSCSESKVIVVIQWELSSTFRAFSRNDNYTTSCTCTIDSCWSCILQYTDWLDIFGVYHIEVTFHIINQYEWLNGVSVWTVRVLDTHRIGSTNLERLTGSGSITSIRYKQSRHGSLKSIRCIQDRTVTQYLIHFHRRYGSGQIRFLLRTITYYHYFFQRLGIIHHNHFQWGLISYLNILCYVSYIRNTDHSIRMDRKREFTIDIGNRTIGRVSFF